MPSRAALLATLLLCAAAPEPAGYWLGPANAEVPASLTGGHVIHTEALVALLRAGPVVLIDVAAAPRRPPDAKTPWLPLPHTDIPGSVWLPEAGLGAAPPEIDAAFRRRLAELTHNHRAAPIVVYCHAHCWLSWNAARRAVRAGYTNVSWYPEGMEGWKARGRAPGLPPYHILCTPRPPTTI